MCCESCGEGIVCGVVSGIVCAAHFSDPVAASDLAVWYEALVESVCADVVTGCVCVESD